MRPASPVRYASTHRSPSRYRTTAHAPHFKTKKAAMVEVSLTNTDIALKSDQFDEQTLISPLSQQTA
ncbi:hypothetical protein [Photobacterium lucens]|uniref:hypothetical protein n=1 Tax=Photobacterium lucens TaxID=2562949 RepID=UPI0006B65144|nr:hypothetical protein [Photobacterium lucens]KPA54622.1 hypothetical protein VT25_01075 [Photobacterium leiognathi subsp. mandapamensis]MBP2702159.1 hypothetical protein [Vibrio parahaemolyticus]MZG57153.1 hypothetical protein [Photobacterium lucens]MZG81024.1 hypothetical protein [Photobacterium lucens]